MSPTPRVLHVIPSIAPRYGGPSAAVVGMSEALRAAGVQTLIATTDADGPSRLEVPLGTETTHQGEPTIFFRRAFSEAFKWSGALSAWLETHVRDFDVVHIHAVFSHASIAAGRACRARRVPYLVRPLGTLDPWSLRQKQWQKRVLYPLGVRKLLTGAAALHYTTDEERRLVETSHGALRRGVVVPIGVPDGWLDQPIGVADDPPYALVLSRLDRKKRLEWIIGAWHQFAATGRLGRWRLIVAGDGVPAYVNDLCRLASEGPAAGRITFTGWVGGDRKADLLKGASVFLLPSHQENFGVGLVEAMAAGVPAVVTPGVNLGADIVAAGAGWVADDSADALARVIVRVMASNADRQAAGRRARAFADRFRWTRVAGDLLGLYEAVVRRDDAVIGLIASHRTASVPSN